MNKKYTSILDRFLAVKVHKDEAQNGLLVQEDGSVFLTGSVFDVTYVIAYSMALRSKFVSTNLYILEEKCCKILESDEARQILKNNSSYIISFDAEGWDNLDKKPNKLINVIHNNQKIRLYSINEENLKNAFLQLTKLVGYKLVDSNESNCIQLD